jgi:ribosomal protein L29
MTDKFKKLNAASSQYARKYRTLSKKLFNLRVELVGQLVKGNTNDYRLSFFIER